MSGPAPRGRSAFRRHGILTIVALFVVAALMMGIAVWLMGISPAVLRIGSVLDIVQPVMLVVRLFAIYLLWRNWSAVVGWLERRYGLREGGRDAALGARHRVALWLLVIEALMQASLAFGDKL